MTSPVAEHPHGSRPRPTWRRRQDDRFTNYARARARQERSTKHGDRVGDRLHVVRPPQPTGRKTCNSIVTIDPGRDLTRREHVTLRLMLLKIPGITVVNFQGGNILCAIDLYTMGMDLDSCEVMIQDRVDEALE